MWVWPTRKQFRWSRPALRPLTASASRRATSPWPRPRSIWRPRKSPIRCWLSFDALEAVSNEPDSDVPSHLRDGNRDSEGFGHGAGYLYPHAYRDHWVAQQYLPGALQGRVFYEPTGQGYEAGDQSRGDPAPRGPAGRHAGGLRRSAGDPDIRTRRVPPATAGSSVRLHRPAKRPPRCGTAFWTAAPLERHSVVLDVNAGSGLLTWEALRRAPEGGVYALAFNESDRQALQEQAQNLDEVERPVVLQGAVEETAQLLGTEEVRFDAIIGRNAMLRLRGQRGCPGTSGRTPGRGRLACAGRDDTQTYAENLRFGGSRSATTGTGRAAGCGRRVDLRRYDGLPWSTGTRRLCRQPCPPSSLKRRRPGGVSMDRIDTDTDLRITEAHIRRWFSPAPGARKSYAERLAEQMQPDEVEQVEGWIRGQLLNRTVVWRRRTVLIRVGGR